MRFYLMLTICLSLLISAQPIFAIDEWKSDNFKDFIQGEVENVSITSHGELRLAPELTEVFNTEEPYVWCAVSDQQGNVYLGTGNNGKVFKITPSGQGSLLYDAEELEATALTVDQSRNVYIGTSPDGKVYRLTPDGEAKVYFDPEETYIWALLADNKGVLYAATGNTGKIYKITAENQATVLYDSN